MNLRKSTLKLVLLALVTALLFSGTALAFHEPGKGKTVNPARATWDTEFFQVALVSRGLEELGYKVEDPKEFSNPIFYQSVMQGDVDFWANGWFPLHDAQLPKNFDQGAKIAGTMVKAGAIQGYLVSKRDVEKFNITSLADFKRPEVKKAFDANGDGKADLVACPPGWGCEKAIDEHLEQYDLKDHINPIKAGYSASMADALARYGAGEPVFFYTWTPNWTIYKFKPGEDVLWINVPEVDDEDMVATGVEGAVTDPLKMGFVANDIAIVANKDFLSKNPAAAKFFEVIQLPLPDIAAQNIKMFEGEDRQRDIERHVDEWIAKNKSTWESWLNDAKLAAAAAQ